MLCLVYYNSYEHKMHYLSEISCSFKRGTVTVHGIHETTPVEQFAYVENLNVLR